MAFKVLSEDVTQEARHVAAAFGVRKWKRIHPQMDGYTLEGFDKDNNRIEFYCLQETGKPRMISVGSERDTCSYWDEEDGTILNNLSHNDEVLARGLYRLGLDEDVLSQLPPLSDHKRTELRLSMPREFWPQRWLDEQEPIS